MCYLEKGVGMSCFYPFSIDNPWEIMYHIYNYGLP